MKERMQERFGNAMGGGYGLTPLPPQSLNIELNNTCNHHCVFCPFHSPYVKKSEPPAHMEITLAKKILDKAKEQGIGGKEIGFYSTGEALLHKGLEECIGYAKKLGCPYVFLTTNGSLATPQRIVSLIDAGLDSVRFSVNGTNREEYLKLHGMDHFGQVMANIEFLHKYRQEKNINIRTSVSCVITKETRHNTHKIHELLGNLVDEIICMPVMDLETLGAELVEEYAVEDSTITNSTRRICPILFNSMYIGGNGRMRICCDARATHISAGDLNQDIDLMKAWNGEIMRHYRQLHIQGEISDSICNSCQMSMRPVDKYFLNE